jgi:ribosomal protein L37E
MKSIYTAPVIECERCGSVTADESTHLCYWCGKEKAIDHAFKDVCRKLFNH